MKTRHVCLKLTAFVFCTALIHETAQSGAIQFTGSVVEQASASLVFAPRQLLKSESRWHVDLRDAHLLSEISAMASIDLLNHFASYAPISARVINVTYK